VELKVTPWNRETPPTEDELSTLLIKQELKVYHWSKDPESVQAGHTHGYHKVVYVVTGTIKFDLPTRHKMINLNPGDRLELPAGTRHSVLAGPDGVTCLEAHIY